jgi:general secretion pathway protein I
LKIVSLKLKNKGRGFTLLEVMVALAILGLSLLALFMAQSRSMRMAEKGRLITIATQLARSKLIDCKFDLNKNGFPKTDYFESGDFSEEGFADFEWECFAYRFDVPPPNAESIAKGIKAQSGDMANKGGMDFSANMLAPFFGLISTTLGDSLKEMVLIVRWKDGETPDELRVVTHVIDRAAMTILASQLPDNAMLPPGFIPPGAKPAIGGAKGSSQ